jgi:hypothetical protein
LGEAPVDGEIADAELFESRVEGVDLELGDEETGGAEGGA